MSTTFGIIIKLSKTVMKVIVNESDWDESEYRTREWEQSVKIIRWEHNYEENVYIIEYEPKH
mgnify:CR=1 FL=1